MRDEYVNIFYRKSEVFLSMNLNCDIKIFGFLRSPYFFIINGFIE